MAEVRTMPLFRTQAEEDAFDAKCASNDWKLVDSDGKEYKCGDEVQLDGVTYKITGLEPPRHPGSTGHVSAQVPGAVFNSCRYYAGVWGLKFV